MMPFPPPILPPEWDLHISTTALSIVVVSLSALIYMALALVPFWRDPTAESPDLESHENPFTQGEKK
jgi:hypothetical protein